MRLVICSRPPSADSPAALATARTSICSKRSVPLGQAISRILPIQQVNWIEGDPGERILFRDTGETQLRFLVPFSLDGNGNAWCFLVDQATGDAEYRVAYLDTTGRRLYGRQESFTAWLSILVEKQEEVIRTLYGEDVLEGELNLG